MAPRIQLDTMDGKMKIWRWAIVAGAIVIVASSVIYVAVAESKNRAADNAVAQDLAQLARSKASWDTVHQTLTRLGLRNGLVFIEPSTGKQVLTAAPSADQGPIPENIVWLVKPQPGEILTAVRPVLLREESRFFVGPWRVVVTLYFNRSNKVIGARKWTVPPRGL